MPVYSALKHKNLIELVEAKEIAGGFAMGKMGKTRKFLRGFMLGMLYFLLLLAISAGIYRSVQGGMQMMIAWILCGAGGMLGGMVS